MRPSLPLHGIKGIFPLIRSLTPSSISPPLPLAALQGFRLAVDATLLIQRLHFADDPHESRHLIGFYRLITSLRQHDIQPIMVFDHPNKRLALKDREQIKRQKTREINRVRNQMENVRKYRLRQLERAMDVLKSLPPDERRQVGELLQMWQHGQTTSASDGSHQDTAMITDSMADQLLALHLETTRTHGPDAERLTLDWQQLRHHLGSQSPLSQTCDNVAAPINDDSSSESIEASVELMERLHRHASLESPDFDSIDARHLSVTHQALHSVSSTNSESESAWLDALQDLTSRVFALAFQLHRLQREFRLSLAKMGQYQSKGQKELTEHEKNIYERITQSLMTPEDMPASSVGTLISASEGGLLEQHEASSQVDEEVSLVGETPSISPLTTLNSGLSKTYTRSTAPLSSTIYTDCAHLCTLMAVPVFWTGDGTRAGGGKVHEAEAFASSLVQAGFADLVASEDSDVLLYDMPLVRGLLGGIKASHGRRMVEIVDSKRVRKGFFSHADVQKLLNRAAREGQDAKGIRLVGCGGRKDRRSRKRKTTMLDPAPVAPEPEKPLGSAEYDKVNRSLMLDFALLCGTDFNRTVPGIGPKTALKLLLQHGSISNILRRESKKFRPPEGLSIKEYETELRDARMVFLNPPKVRAVARGMLGPAPITVQEARTVTAEQHEPRFLRLFPSSDDMGPETTASDAISGVLDNTAETEVTSAGVTEHDDQNYSLSAGQDRPAESIDAASTLSSPQFDKGKVLDFLRQKGVFRRSGSSRAWAGTSGAESLLSLDGSGDAVDPEEWRYLMDLELGIRAESSGDEASMGVDYFGESLRSGSSGVACWSPEMEEKVRRQTSVSGFNSDST